MKKWPKMKNNASQTLGEFVAFVSQYVAQSKSFEEGAGYNPANVIWDMESKFNLKLLEEYREKLESHVTTHGSMNKDQQVSWTLKWLNNKVKLRRMDEETRPDHVQAPLGLQISAMRNANEGKKKKEKEPTQSHPTVASFATPVQEEVSLAMEVPKKGRNRGKGRGKDNGKGGQGSFQNWKAAPGSGNAAGTSTAKPAQKQPTKGDTIPCLFCKLDNHPTRLCFSKKVSDPWAAFIVIKNKLCINCLRKGHAAEACPHPPCGVDGCKELHHSRFHAKRKQPE